MWQFMACQELTLSCVHKTTFTYGSTRVKLQDLQCLNQQDKLDIESLVVRFVGLLNKNQILTRFMTWINLITQSNVKTLSVPLLSVNKCLLLVGKVGLSEDSLFLTSLRNQNYSGSHFQWSLVSTVIKLDSPWLISLESLTFWKLTHKVEVFWSSRRKNAGLWNGATIILCSFLSCKKLNLQLSPMSQWGLKSQQRGTFVHSAI